MNRSAVVVTALFLPLACSDSARTQEKPPYPVTMDVAVGKHDGEGKQKIVVTLTIGKGYHTFANPVGHEDLEANKPVLRVEGKNIGKDVAFSYPKGELVEDKVVGNYRIYTGTVKFEAVVQRRKLDPEPLTVSVRIRPHDARGCIWGTRTLTKTVR